MNDENRVPRKHKRYDENFKRSAVDLWISGSKSIQQIASELGISGQSLKKWKQKLSVLPATGPGQRSWQQPKRKTDASNANCCTLPGNGTF